MKKDLLKIEGNGLILADIHIKKDDRFSPEENYRLKKQPEMLFIRIKEIIKEEKIGWIAILGDLLDICNCLPQELDVLNQFFENLNSLNISVLVILGQHDIDANVYDDKIVDIESRSHVTTLIKHFDNIYYAHNKYITLNDKYLCYLSNYNYPLTYPEKYVDLWLTHCSLGFVHVDELNEDGSKKFGLMVAGDIHDHVVYGNCFSVGTPYQHKAREQQLGVVGIIKVTDKKISFFRKFTDSGDIQFLKFDPPPTSITIKNNLGEIIDINVNQSNVLEEIETKVKELGIEYIHNKISKEGAPNPINFNFKINRLILENYKSCRKLDLDFTTFNKVLYLLGEYRVGKSTIVEALQDVFFGSTKIMEKKVTHGEIECRVQVDLSYENKNYSIVRGIIGKDKGVFQFFIEGVEQTANNKKSIEGLMKNLLPFVDYLYLFLPPSNERLFTPEKGLILFQRCFNLDVFDYYLDQSVKLKKLFNEENNGIFNSVKIKEGERNILQQEVDRLKNTLLESKIKTEGDYNVLINTKEDLLGYKNEKNQLEYSINILNNFINTTKILDISEDEVNKMYKDISKKIENLEKLKLISDEKSLLEKNYLSTKEEYKSLSDLKKPLIAEKPNISKEEIIKKKSLIREINDNALTLKNNLTFKLNEIEKSIIDVKKSIDNSEYICPTCGQPVKKHINDLKKELSLYEEQKELIENDLSKITFEDELKLDSAFEYYKIVEHNEIIDLKLKEIVVKGTELKKQLEEINKNISEFDSNELDSLKSKLDEIKNDLSLRKVVSEKTIELKKEKESLKVIEDLLLKKFNIKSNEDLDNQLREIDEKISYHTIYNNYKKELASKEADLENCNMVIDQLSIDYNKGIKQLEDWDTYISLMDYNNLNSIPYKLIDMLITNFNTDKFKISTSRTQKNGNEKFSIDLSIKDDNYGYWVSYNAGASGAQKLLLDLFLYDSISKFMGGIGILSLDENLNTASVGLYSELNDLIPSMAFNNIIIISHSQQISCYDKKIIVYLNDKHESVYSGINEKVENVVESVSKVKKTTRRKKK